MSHAQTPHAAPLAYRLLAERILADAKEHGTYFGDRKVFLCTVPSIDLTDAHCRQELADLLRMGLLHFSRADLVSAMDPTLVRSSEFLVRGPMGIGTSEYHFLVVQE